MMSHIAGALVDCGSCIHAEMVQLEFRYRCDAEFVVLCQLPDHDSMLFFYPMVLSVSDLCPRPMVNLKYQIGRLWRTGLDGPLAKV